MGDSLENMINKPSKLGQVWKAVKRYTVAPLVLATGLYAMGCGGNGNDGDAVNPLPAGYNVSSNITPSDGGSVGPDDSPLEVGVDTPAISSECSSDPECSAAAEAGMDVTITGTADNGTPGDASDDDTQTVVSHTGVPFGSYTSGDLDLDSFHDGAGLQDGEQVTLEATLVATDSDGNPHELQGSVSVVYEEGATGPRIPDNWHLDGNNYNAFFSLKFNVTNVGSSMTYSIKDFADHSLWFADYFNVDSPRIRGPPEHPNGELASDSMLDTWGNFEFVIEACDNDTGLCGEATIYGSIDRYTSELVAQNGSRTCTVDITNAAADYIGASDGSYPGIEGYVETTHTDGSAVRTSEVNNTEPGRLSDVSDRIAGMPANMVDNVRRVSSTTLDSDASWDCIEAVYTEGGELRYQIIIEEP